MSEACTLAAVPIPMERIKRTEKATKVSRGRRRVEKDLSEVEDERVKEVLARVLKWEKRGDKARALVEARKREKEAKLEALKGEAELDPKKIPVYLEALDSPLSRRVLRDLREACKLEKVSLKVGCVKAFEDWNPNWHPEIKTFEDTVEQCLSQWARSVRINNATNKYTGTTFDCLCSKCDVKYEYRDISPANTFTCPKCWNTVYYPCPVCREGWRSEEQLEYDSETDTLCCPKCKNSYNVTPPALNKKGTALIRRILAS